MTTPGWYALLILALGTFRLCRLIGWDDITTPLRPKLVGLSDEEHSQWTYVLNALQTADRDPWDYYSYTTEIDAFVGDLATSLGVDDPQIPPLVQRRLDRSHLQGPNDRSIVPFSRVEWYASKLIRCPWCLSVYVGAAAWLTWQAWPHATLALLSLPALWAFAGLIGKLDLSN